ncbi:MAG: glycosyltransferase family 2 protein [Chitinophagales bacterium]|nr:glycosyltransferase family 2 protein [Chitinophagales bacterium]MDW8273785.1 glycosyltransferase family 2 protein [Chitinophagales bacterium]
MYQPELSLILPCYRPKPGWVQTIKSEVEFFENLGIRFEIVLVNDGDGEHITSELQLSLLDRFDFFTIINYSNNKGKGYALREGVKAARGKWIIYTDIDFPYTRQSFLSILHALQNGADLAVGVRSSDYYRSVHPSRQAISWLLRLISKTIFRLPTGDTQCGLKGFNTKTKPYFLQTTINRYLFDLEFLRIASRSGLNIVLCDVYLKPDIYLPPMPLTVLLTESINLFRIMLR